MDTVFLSHPHQDHMQGLLSISEKIPIHRVFTTRPPEFGEELYQNLWDLWQNGNTEIILANTKEKREEKSIELLHPNGWMVHSKDRVNEESLVFYIEHENHRFLFTGDIEEDAQRRMLEQEQKNQTSKIDVVKIPHHGSRSSASQKWVHHFTSPWAVISCGYRNQFRHPHQETLDVWKDSTILRTDLNGSIEFRSDGKSMSIRGFHQERGWYWIKN